MKNLLPLCICLLLAVPCGARTITVDDDGDTDFNNIQAAINDSNNGDIILVSPGIYTGDGNRDIDFLGKAITVRSRNGPEVTIVVGQSNRSCFYFHSVEGVDSVLEGFTITGGDRGVRCSHGAPTITNCIISGNRDGIACYYQRPKITNCIIAGNGRHGIQCSRSSPRVTNCTISDNGGSGILFVGGRANITDCIITGNNYGGIYCVSSSPRITNCLIASNDNQWDGGGINSHEGGNPTIQNCTITGNSSVGNGGGIFFEGGQLTLRNCIVWRNRDSSGINESSQIYYGGWIISIKHSCIQDWSGIFGGTDNIGADPCFVSPGYWEDNGTPTYYYFWVDGDYHLLEDSPCIDAGDPNYIAGPNETDLDGKPRVIGGRIDMGAYEYRPSIPAEVRIVPRTINLTSKGKWITSYIWLSEDYNVADIDPNSILLEDEIEPEWIWFDEQQQVAIAKFSRSEVQGILDIGEVELTISGELSDGTIFEGTDVIRVIDKGGRKTTK